MRIRRRGHDDVLELVDLGPEAVAPGSVPGVRGEHRTGDVRDFSRRELPDALVLARVLSDATLADGVARAAMLAVVDRWDRLSEEDDPGALLRSVIADKAFAALRRRRLGRCGLARVGLRQGVDRPADEGEAFWLDVRRLPRPDREALALTHALGLRLDDVAASLGCSGEDAGHHLEAGRAALGVTGDEADSIGRRTRAAVTDRLDVDVFLDGMRAGRTRRRRALSAGAGTVVAGIVVAVAFGLGSGDTAVRPVLEPAAPALPTTRCESHPAVRCITATEIAIQGEVSYRFNLPEGFSHDLDVALAPGVVDVYQDTVSVQAGVTLMERVRAVGGPRREGRDLGARGLARWIASRSFLVATPVRRDHLANREAWTVEVRLDAQHGGLVPGACNGGGIPCFPLLRLYPNGVRWETGIWSSMLSRYTFVDVPGLGTVAVWSWAFNGDRQALARNEALIDSVVL